MKKKRIRFKYLILDLLIIALCLYGAYYSFNLFYKELNHNTVRTDKEQIAQVLYKNKISQRKFIDRVVWERLNNDTLLYNKDTIRTAENANVKIGTEGNVILDLYENSMVQIVMEDGVFSVVLSSGSVDVDTTNADSSVLLKLHNGSVIELKAGSKISTISNDSEANFILHAGKAFLNTDAEEELLVGDNIVQKGNGAIEFKPITITSMNPNYYLYNFENILEVQIPFDWAVSKEYKNIPIIMETSKDSQFRNILQKYDLGTLSSTVISSTEGILYYRLYPVTNPELFTEGKVYVVNVPKLSLISPAVASKIVYTQDMPVINFLWEGNDYASGYKIEISKTSDFSQLEETQEVTSTKVTINTLREGDYYWRVVPFYPINNIGFRNDDTYSNFTIKMELANEKPKLVYPSFNSTVYIGTEETALSFVWKSDVKNSVYDLLISTDADFNSIIYKKQTTTTNNTEDFTQETLPTGQYYWKVIRDSSYEDLSESKIYSFKVELPDDLENKLLYPPQNYNINLANLNKTNFLWQLSSNNQKNLCNSILQISTDIDFKKIVFEQKTDKSEVQNVNIARGKFYWRVAVEKDSEIKEYTDIREINVLEELETPKIIWPVKNEPLILEKNTINGIWKSVPNADYYNVQVIDSQTEETILSSTNITECSSNLPLPKDLKLDLQKEYIYQVQAFSNQTELSDYNQSELSKVEFNLRKPLKVQLVYPNNNRIDGLNAIKNVTFEWKQGDKPEKVQFILRKQQQNGTMKIIRTINKPSKQIQISGLTEGKYDWTIKATNKNGVVLDAPSYYSFTVMAVPNLSLPVLAYPENDFLITTDYLKQNRTITFNWQPVENATDYDFYLYILSENGRWKKILSKTELKTCEFTLNDFTILDIGKFEWRVVAKSHGKNKYEEQTSREAKRNFSIQFELPQKVKTIDPGKQYGE